MAQPAAIRAMRSSEPVLVFIVSYWGWGVSDASWISHRQACVPPAGETTEICRAESLGRQRMRGRARTRARRAVEDQLALFVAGQERLPLGAGAIEIAQGEQVCRGRDASGPFRVLADVDESSLAVADEPSGLGG